MKFCNLAVLATVLTLGAFATGTYADEASPAAFSDIKIVDCRQHDAVQEQKDRDLALEAFGLMQAHDMSTLDSMTRKLEAALDRAPDVPSSSERCGDKINLYTDDMGQMFLMTAFVSRTPGLEKVSVVQYGALPYGQLGFIVGWIRFEHEKFAAAYKAYARGLRNDPNDFTLINEMALTLSHLRRNDEGLALVDDFLAAHDTLDDKAKAALQRKRGYILVELQRLDEARAAYEESLRLEPGNAVAMGELDYIAQQKH